MWTHCLREISDACFKKPWVILQVQSRINPALNFRMLFPTIIRSSKDRCINNGIFEAFHYLRFTHQSYIIFCYLDVHDISSLKRSPLKMDGWKTFSFPFGTIPQVNYRFGMVVASMIDRTGFRFPTSVFLGKIFFTEIRKTLERWGVMFLFFKSIYFSIVSLLEVVEYIHTILAKKLPFPSFGV